MPLFNNIPLLPEDPIFGLAAAFVADTRPNKINLGIGSYKNAEGKPYILPSVQKAEKLLLNEMVDKEYLPIEGDALFLKYSLDLLFGKDSPLLRSQRIFAAQTVGGAGALRIGAELLSKFVAKSVFISDPSWSNHKQIFEEAHFFLADYPYFDFEKRRLDFHGMYRAIQNMPPRSVVLLHGCCHNPTGIDPSFEQWKELSCLIRKQQLIPFFDIAYQGFGNGIDADAKAIRYFAEEGHEMLVAYSYSKNFGLYGERVGFLTVISSDEKNIPNIASQVKRLIRANYSNPPLHGERIVSAVLGSEVLKEEWVGELSLMRARVEAMRSALFAALRSANNTFFESIELQKGLFSYLGLSIEQVERLRKEKAIYMPSSGRINVAGLNEHNLSYVAESILQVW